MRPRPDRHSIRLRAHVYARPGAYFVTICAQGRRPLLSEVVGGLVHPTAAGRMVHEHWRSLSARFRGIEADECVIMPDHVHGILWIGGAITRAVGVPPVAAPAHGPGRPAGPAKHSGITS